MLKSHQLAETAKRVNVAQVPRVMPLLYNDEGDSGLVIGLQLDAGLADGGQLVLQDLIKEIQAFRRH
jgi:hypothetical protein